MVRFKVKTGSSAVKVEVPGTSCLFSDLKDAIVQEVFAGDSQALKDLRLSFNNRDCIQGDDDADIKSLGIAAGDLLWILSPTASAQQPADGSRVAKRVQQEMLPPAALEKPLTSKPCLRGEPGEYSQATDTDTGDAPSLSTMPSYLLRVLTQHGSAEAAVLPETPAHVLLLAAHAAMLETGFQPAWVSAPEPSPSGSHCPPNLAPTGNPFLLPRFARTSASLFNIQYFLPGLQQQQVEGAALAAQAAGSSSTASGAAGAAGSAALGHEETGFHLQCSTLGASTAVLVASTPQGHFRNVSLSAGAFLTPHQGDPAAPICSTTAGGTAKEESVPPSNTRHHAPGAPAVASGVVLEGPMRGLPCWNGQYMSVLGGSYRMDPQAVRRLWRLLEDELALPMLLAGYAEAGLPPPTGLLALPEEVKLSVLQQLNALQLAAACGTCTQLRHLASQDELWKPLFEEEFPAAGSFYVSQGERRGFKWAFGACWRDRREREEALRRQRRFMPAIPNMGPRPSFYPPPGRMGIPGVTGGDYDRLPQAFLGGGPGMYPGGLFGGGRRQGGRGSGGFHMF